MKNTIHTHTRTLVKITVEIPPEWHEFKTTNRLTWAEIVGLGIKAKQGNPQLISRIKELENVKEILSNKLQFHARKTFELEEKLAKLSENPAFSQK